MYNMKNKNQSKHSIAWRIFCNENTAKQRRIKIKIILNVKILKSRLCHIYTYKYIFLFHGIAIGKCGTRNKTYRRDQE